MSIRIFTIPFDPQKGLFQDEDLSKFLLNKHIRRLQPEFFQLDGHAYWTVFVEYETVVSEDTAESDGLDTAQRLLFQRLKEWRKELAEKDGIPVFIIATNKQLLNVIKRAPVTLEALRAIHGFGNKKISRYGADLIDMIKAFYEKKPARDAVTGKSNEPKSEVALEKTN